MSTSVPSALTAHALAAPLAPAVTDLHGTVDRAEVELAATSLAHCYADMGVGVGDIVTLALPSDRSMIVAAIAAWKLGATPQPVAPDLPRHELDGIVAVSQPALVVGLSLEPGVPSLVEIPPRGTWSSAPLPDVVSPSWKAPVSGGSTGLPKVILSTTPAEVEPLTSLSEALRVRRDDVVLATAPLHHNAPFMFAMTALMLGSHVVLPGRFSPEGTLRLIEQHQVGWTYLVPTMMSRVSKLAEEVRSSYDLSSLHTVFHMAAPCPVWLKQAWIDWLGADRIWELYAGTEAQAATVISGGEWLAHPGSVGRPIVGELRVLDETGTEVPAGTVGEVWMRPSHGPTYRYLGAEPRSREGGWESLGDLGHLDEEGYLYLADRLADMVLVGGVNVYPAEVEAALDEHPDVVSSVVVGLPDADLGNVLHAFVQTSSEMTDDQLTRWCADRVSRHKVPRSFERVERPLRDEAAKVRRQALRHQYLSRSGQTA